MSVFRNKEDMPMQMGFRWYGEGNDKITLSDIRQIPGVSTIVWALHDKMPGEVWQPEEIEKVVSQIRAAGFNADVVESVNVHDDIKIGLPTRDQYIDNYIQTIRNLAPFGVKVICYNFMPIFDWTRSDLFHPVGDGSTALYYQKDMIQDDPKEMADYVMSFTEKYHMTFPGWEPERMAKLDELFEKYKDVTKEKLWENFRYFLERLMPVCHETGIKMAVHMDDPPWDIFGLPRLLVDEESIDRFLKMVDDPYNCLTLCSGSLNANPENNVAGHRPQALRPHRLRPYPQRQALPQRRLLRGQPPGLRRRHRHPGDSAGLPRRRLPGLYPPRPRAAPLGREAGQCAPRLRTV